MYKITRTSIRPNAQTPFYVTSQEFRDYANTNYIETGKFTYSEPVLSGDLLTETVVFTYASMEAFQEVITDPVFIRDSRDPRNEHSLINGITITFVGEEI